MKRSRSPTPPDAAGVLAGAVAAAPPPAFRVGFKLGGRPAKATRVGTTGTSGRAFGGEDPPTVDPAARRDTALAVGPDGVRTDRPTEPKAGPKAGREAPKAGPLPLLLPLSRLPHRSRSTDSPNGVVPLSLPQIIPLLPDTFRPAGPAAPARSGRDAAAGRFLPQPEARPEERRFEAAEPDDAGGGGAGDGVGIGADAGATWAGEGMALGLNLMGGNSGGAKNITKYGHC